jgi:hypothetical protein
MSLITPQLFSEVADDVTCNSYRCHCVSLLREPDAQIRTCGSMSGVWKRKHGGTSEAATNERVGHRWVPPKPPRHTSTPHSDVLVDYFRIADVRGSQNGNSG